MKIHHEHRVTQTFTHTHQIAGGRHVEVKWEKCAAYDYTKREAEEEQEPYWLITFSVNGCPFHEELRSLGMGPALSFLTRSFEHAIISAYRPCRRQSVPAAYCTTS